MRRRNRPSWMLGTAGALLCVVPALGQTQDPIRLDPGLSDINALQISLRALPPILRHDTAFEHVYQSPVDPNQRYRVAGGIYAVFDASDYIPTPYGSVPVYPAGVQFHIGPPPGFAGNPLDPTFGAPNTGDLDLRSADRVTPEAFQSRANRAVMIGPAPPHTISSEAVRSERLRAITAKAMNKSGLGG